MANKEGRRKRKKGWGGRERREGEIKWKNLLKNMHRLYSRYLVYLMMDLFQIIDSFSTYYIIHQIPFYIIYTHTHRYMCVYVYNIHLIFKTTLQQRHY